MATTTHARPPFSARFADRFDSKGTHANTHTHIHTRRHRTENNGSFSFRSASHQSHKRPLLGSVRGSISRPSDRPRGTHARTHTHTHTHLQRHRIKNNGSFFSPPVVALGESGCYRRSPEKPRQLEPRKNRRADHPASFFRKPQLYHRVRRTARAVSTTTSKTNARQNNGSLPPWPPPPPFC